MVQREKIVCVLACLKMSFYLLLYMIVWLQHSLLKIIFFQYLEGITVLSSSFQCFCREIPYSCIPFHLHFVPLFSPEVFFQHTFFLPGILEFHYHVPWRIPCFHSLSEYLVALQTRNQHHPSQKFCSISLKMPSSLYFKFLFL